MNGNQSRLKRARKTEIQREMKLARKDENEKWRKKDQETRKQS